MEESRAALAVLQNDDGRWEWLLTFSDEVSLPSRRVSDEDYPTRDEARAAGEAAREHFQARSP
jgi:hypothetical protein